MDCKRALDETSGDIGEGSPEELPAQERHRLRQQEGLANGSRKDASYIHLQGKVGVLVEINCETDSWPRTTSFGSS